jgi:mannose-1-phosphate guanylyltransferase
MRIKAALGTPAEQRVIVETFETLDSISIDYGIMEKAENTYVIPADFGWDDVGSWAALPDVWGVDDDGNTLQGQIVALDTHDSIAYTDDGVIALIGVEDVIVAKVGNAVLVCSRNQAQKVRSIVNLLKENGLSEYV